MRKWHEYKECTTLEEAQEVQLRILTEGIPESQQNSYKRLQSLMKYASRCRSIKEIGTYQGSAFMAMFMQPSVQKGSVVDIDLNGFNEYLGPLLLDYARREGKRVSSIESSSLDKKTVSLVDMLHIDSFHQPDHLQKELELHAESTSRYIAFHDIKQNNWALLKVIENFCSQNIHWRIVERLTGGKCGHAVIARNATKSDEGIIEPLSEGPTAKTVF